MKNENLFQSFKNAFDGFKSALMSERNFRIHVAVGLLVICASFYFRLDSLSFAAVIFAIGAVLTTELINTAIEAMVDLYCGENISPYAKTAKDAAAAAVLISSVFAVTVGVLVFGNKILEMFKVWGA